MTQGYIDDLGELIKRRNDAVVAWKKEYHRMSEEIRVMESHCDHRLPNGKSADNGGPIMGFCTICNRSMG